MQFGKDAVYLISGGYQLQMEKLHFSLDNQIYLGHHQNVEM